MKLTISTRPPCRLGPGELRRVPQNLKSGIVGYHVCCPRCGFVTVAFNGKDGFQITEDDTRSVVTFSRPMRCTYCSVLIHLRNGEAELEEDEHVRNIRYKKS
jgi:hypothetical protein